MSPANHGNSQCLPGWNIHNTTSVILPRHQNDESADAGKLLENRACYPVLSTRYTNQSLEEYRPSDVYAECIAQMGNEDAPNAIAPELLARLPQEEGGILKGRPLLVRNEPEQTITLYTSNSPPGGERPDNREPYRDAVKVRLKEEHRGDNLYRKLIASCNKINPKTVTNADIARLREAIVSYVLKHPEQAEAAYQAVENDPLDKRPFDEAVETYNQYDHSKEPVFTPKPARPWLEPLLNLASGVTQFCQQLSPPLSSTASFEQSDSHLSRPAPSHEFVLHQEHQDRMITGWANGPNDYHRGAESGSKESRMPDALEAARPVEIKNNAHTRHDEDSETLTTPDNHLNLFMAQTKHGLQAAWNALPNDPLKFPAAAASSPSYGVSMAPVKMAPLLGLPVAIRPLWDLASWGYHFLTGQPQPDLQPISTPLPPNENSETESLKLSQPSMNKDAGVQEADALEPYKPEELLVDESIVRFLITIVVLDLDKYQHNIENLYETLSDRLMGKRGTDVYSPEDIERYMHQYQALCEHEKKNTTLLASEQLDSYTSLFQSGQNETETGESLKVWVRVDDPVARMLLLIPYSMPEILSGALSSYSMDQLILPGSLEPFRDLMTHQHLTDILQQASLADQIATIRTPIEAALNSIAYPHLLVEQLARGIFQEKADNIQLGSNIQLDTVIGDYILNERITRITVSRNTMPYTPLDFLLNTGKAITADDATRKFIPSGQYRFNQKVHQLVEALAKEDFLARASAEITELSASEQFTNSLADLMATNAQFYHPSSDASTEHQLMIENSAHPFITALYQDRNERGQPASMSQNVTLFSYLTGQQLTVSYQEFQKSSATQGSELFSWLTHHGGEYPTWLLSNGGSMKFQPFQMNNIDTGEQKILRWRVYSKYESNIESYHLTRAEFIRQALEKAPLDTRRYVDEMYRSYDEVQKTALFDFLGEVFSITGYIPIVGDAVDILSFVVLATIEHKLEEDFLPGKQLEDEFIVNFSASLAMSLVPGMTMAAGKKVVRVFAKALKAKSIAKIAGSSLDGLGRPLKEIDTSVPSKKQPIEPDSLAWKTACQIRKRRMVNNPGSSCSSKVKYDPNPTTELTTDQLSIKLWKNTRPGQWFVGVLDTHLKKVIIEPVSVFAGPNSQFVKDNSYKSTRTMNRYASGAEGEIDGFSRYMSPYLWNLPDDITFHQAVTYHAGFSPESSLGFGLIKINNEFAQMKLASNSLNARKPGSTRHHSFSMQTAVAAAKQHETDPEILAKAENMKNVLGILTGFQVPEGWAQALKSYISEEFKIPNIVISND